MCTNFASRYSCTMRTKHYMFRMEWYKRLHWRIHKLSWASKLVTLFFCRKETEKEMLQYQNAYHTSSTAIFAFIWPASVLNILWQFCYLSLELILLLKLSRFKKSPYLSFDLRRLCEFSDTPKDILFPVERIYEYIGWKKKKQIH